MKELASGREENAWRMEQLRYFLIGVLLWCFIPFWLFMYEENKSFLIKCIELSYLRMNKLNLYGFLLGGGRVDIQLSEDSDKTLTDFILEHCILWL